jgi:two-component system phosphate regulon sensor histidine kinase PhoR
MARLIDDMLSLSRLEMKPYLKAGARVDLKQVLDSVIDSLAPVAGENDLAIERQFANGPMEVPGDRDELYQVFENLLENACKYGQDGDRVVVSIEPGDKGGQPGIDVTIRDFGPGIAEEHIPRVTQGDGAGTCYRQAHPHPPSRPAFHPVGAWQGSGLHRSFADQLELRMGRR